MHCKCKKRSNIKLPKLKIRSFTIIEKYFGKPTFSRGEGWFNKTKNSSSSEGFLFYVKSPPRTVIVIVCNGVCWVYFVDIYIYIFFFSEDGFFVVKRCNVAHNVRRGPTGSIFRPPRQRMTVDPVRDVASFPSAARNTPSCIL